MKKLFLPLFVLCFSAAIFAQNTAGTLTFKVTTVSGGSLSGAHIQAIWITNSTTNSAATFVKTLLAYTGGDKSHLSKFLAAAGSTPNTTDATTGATTSTYGAITKTWNATNTSRVVVPDGNYTVWVEVSDDPTEVSGSWTFAKGPTAVNTTGTATTNLTTVSIAWAPVNTAINDVEMERYYSVYPNPAVSSIYVSGSDVKEVEICSLSGQSLLYSKEQSVNISKLPKGNYLAVIRTTNGTVVKKIQKK
ncbi:MAG: T9SS type A sorting domain-containing protein [Paludibacter sp.]